MSTLNIDWGLAYRRLYIWRSTDENGDPGEPIPITGPMGLRITFLDDILFDLNSEDDATDAGSKFTITDDAAGEFNYVLREDITKALKFPPEFLYRAYVYWEDTETGDINKLYGWDITVNRP